MQLKLIFILISIITNNIFADYPIVGYRHLADPGALVYNGRVYIYCSNDDDNITKDGYDMHSIVCVSSSDLKNWTDHGEVFQVPEGASWAAKSWAPSPAERDGKFYLYFGNGGSGIGVAVADSPIGPFSDPNGAKLIDSNTPGVQPSENMWLFDPMTFVDDDGQAYCYFGGNGENNLRVVPLNNDMISLADSATRFHVPYFFEAAWMHKHNGTYYFSYSTNPQNGIRIDYMTSDNPISGFTYAGVISSNPPNNHGNNNHHATFKLNDEWYQVYHNRIVAIEGGYSTTSYSRNLAIDKIFHNENGTIETMTNTVDGIIQVANLNPYQLVEAETINKQQGIETDKNESSGMKVTELDNGDWIKISGLDFGMNGAAAFTAEVSRGIQLGSSFNNEIEIRLNNVSGRIIGTVPVSYTGGQDNWKSETIAVEEVLGVNDVFFVFKGTHSNLLDFDRWKFVEKNTEKKLIAINSIVENAKIDTTKENNKTKFSVLAVYSDGTSTDVTLESAIITDFEGIISVADSNITGIGYGEVTMTVNYNDLIDSVKVIVKDQETEFSVSKLSTENSVYELNSGTASTIKVYAEFIDGHIEEVTNKIVIDNPKPEIAFINNGKLIGGIEGEVDIIVSYQGDMGESKSIVINVSVRNGVSIWLEPECASVGTNWNIVEDGSVSNEQYVQVKDGFVSLNDAPTNTEDHLVIPFSLSQRGSYSIYSRLNCSSYNNDSFWLKIDDGEYIENSVSKTSEWEWIKIGEYVLLNGNRSLTIGYREDGVKIDKIVITKYDIASQGLGGSDTTLCNAVNIKKKNVVSNEYGLEQNYPNPFNPITTIEYTISKKSKVVLEIFDVLGEKVATLFEGIKNAGNYKENFDGKNISSGVYYYQLKAGEFLDTKKFVLLK